MKLSFKDDQEGFMTFVYLLVFVIIFSIVIVKNIASKENCPTKIQTELINNNQPDTLFVYEVK